MRAVIYARYSSDLQREESIVAQVRACTDYANAKGYTVVGQYLDEAISGKGAKTALRKEYQRMLKDCDMKLFDTILIHKYDRIARNLAEHVNLEKKLHDKEVQLIAVAQDFGDTLESKIVKTLMWSLSEYYIANLGEETRKGHKETALAGKHNGGMGPFGYRIVNQQYVVDELEAEYIRRMFNAAQNQTGFTELIHEMEVRGIKGRYGKPIKYTQIYEILHNYKYTGAYVYTPTKEKSRADQRSRKNAIVVEGAVPAIISKEQFEEVQRIMETRKHAGRKAGYLCSGLVYCTCGAKMHGITSKNSKGSEYRYFYCSAKCGAPRVKMEHIDLAATRYLQDLLSPHNQDKIKTALRVYQKGGQNRLEAFRHALDKKIEEKQKQYDTLMANMTAATLPPQVVQDMGNQMKVLQDEITALKDTPPPEDYTIDQITVWLESLKNAPDQKAVKLLIERIDVKNKIEFNISSTLNSILGNLGADNRT